MISEMVQYVFLNICNFLTFIVYYQINLMNKIIGKFDKAFGSLPDLTDKFFCIFAVK